MKIKGVETTMIGNTIEYIMNDIRKITENVIIKYSNEAASYETISSQREADKYVAAVTERDLFGSYYNYDMSVLAKAGITNLNDLNKYYNDKWSIPYKKRDLVLKYQREVVINEYEERNDYYRLLIGKPPINTPESEFIYLTEEQLSYYKIDEVRPLHEYPQEIQIKLERTVIPELILLHPDKEYLKHMGSKSVNLIRAREAKNFEIIFTDVVLDNVFLRMFFETYDFCREYFMSTIYNKTLASRYDLYDNYIAMCIMIMTVQRLIVDTIKTAIDRDFYDIANLKKFFDCYGVPFFEELPLDYQRNIVKNMNLLIRRKSTDMCLYDITNVLMLNNVNIFKYYLVRERILDDEGEPIIKYKTETDDYGNEKQVLDYQSMYKFYFQSIDIYEPNITVAIENKANKYHYNEVTDEDVHWWEDDDLIKEKYERQYNYIETKYLGVNIMQNLTKLIYDTCYFIHLLVDNKDTTTPMETRILNTDAMKTGTDYLYLNLDRFTPVPVSIFDSVVIMCALVCKKNGMKGNIITQHAGKILSVLGFNFEANFELIRQSINKYKYHFRDKSILKYLDLLDIKVVEDIETLYNNFLNFAEFCKERIALTEDIREYRAYKELFKVFTVREEVGKAFTMTNGKVAETYMEYLYDKLPNIADIIDKLHKDKMGVYIDHVLGRLNELIPDLEYVLSINGTNNNIINALVSMINFFKSYTTDLRNLNILYYLDDKFYNKIRMIHDPSLFVKMYPEIKALKYNDTLNIFTGFDKHDRLVIFSKEEIDNVLLSDDRDTDFIYNDNIIEEFIKTDEVYDDLNLEYSDVISLIKNIVGGDKEYVEDWIHNYSSIDQQSSINDYDKSHIENQLSEEDIMDMEYSDSMTVDAMINIESKEKYYEYGVMSANSSTKDNIGLYDESHAYNDFIYSDEHLDMKYSDSVKDSVKFSKRDKCRLRDRVNIIRED
jgi:hypothetical protein